MLSSTRAPERAQEEFLANIDINRGHSGPRIWGDAPPMEQGTVGVSFNCWWVQFVDALEFADVQTLENGERTCRGVRHLVLVHGLWHRLFERTRMKEAGVPLYAKEVLGLPPRPDPVEWKRRFVQYRDERRVSRRFRVLPLRPSFAVKDCPVDPSCFFGRTAVSVVYRLPFETLRHAPRGYIRTGFFAMPHTHLMCNVDDQMSRVSLLFHLDNDSSDQANERVEVYLSCHHSSTITFHLAALPDDFMNRGAEPQGIRTERGRRFGPNTSTLGWSFRREIFGEDVRIHAQVWMQPASFASGVYKTPDLESSCVREILNSSRFTSLFKMSVLLTFSEPVRQATQSDRLRLQQYLVVPVLGFVEHELKLLRQIVACCGLLWNLLDTSIIALPVHDVDRLICLFCEVGQRCATQMKRASAGVITAVPEGHPPETAAQQLDEARFGFASVVGALWNIPVTDEYRGLLSEHWAFFEEAIIPTIGGSDDDVVHFLPGLHLLATMLHHCQFETDTEEGRRRVVKANEAIIRGVEILENSDIKTWNRLGVCMTARDSADFFIPLLSSQFLSCVRFGAWCIDFYFYKCESQPEGQ